MSKTSYREVETEWEEQREYNLSFKCPYCNKWLYEWNFESIYEGDKVNRLFSCPYCKKKFRLKVEGV